MRIKYLTYHHVTCWIYTLLTHFPCVISYRSIFVTHVLKTTACFSTREWNQEWLLLKPEWLKLHFCTDELINNFSSMNTRFAKKKLNGYSISRNQLPCSQRYSKVVFSLSCTLYVVIIKQISLWGLIIKVPLNSMASRLTSLSLSRWQLRGMKNGVCFENGKLK